MLLSANTRQLVVVLLAAAGSACSRETRSGEARSSGGRDAATAPIVTAPPAWSPSSPRPASPSPDPGAPADSAPNTPPPTGAAPADATITLQRTACFGSCPAYTVVLHGDGRVEYRGDVYVRIDKAEGRILADAAQKVFASLAGAGFWAWKDRYDVPVTDQPSAIVTVSWGGRTKSVSEYPPCDKESGAPPELCILGNTIDRVTGSDDWTKCKDAGGHITRCAMQADGPKRAGEGCEVPYTVDAQGKKHYKPECLAR